MRAAVVWTFGSVTVAAPSFGVLAASTIGNELPPSVDSEILTFGTLIPPRSPPDVVPAT